MAPNMKLIASPARMTVAGETFLILVMPTITAAGMIPVMNAFSIRAISSLRNGTVMPSTIPAESPTMAPDEIPVVYGSARGFLSMACMATPTTARDAPAQMAANALGILSSHTR